MHNFTNVNYSSSCQHLKNISTASNVREDNNMYDQQKLLKLSIPCTITAGS